MKILRFGDYDEILIVRERIVSIEGVPDVDRAGHAIMERSEEDLNGLRPRFAASMVGVDTGAFIQVPHPPAEVERRILPERDEP